MKRLKIFLLEDSTDRIEQFIKVFGVEHDLTICKNFDEAVETLTEYDGIFDIACLDHDLDPVHYVSSCEDDHRTGYWVTKRIITDFHLNFVETAFYVHNLNPFGRKNIYSLLRENSYEAYLAPYNTEVPGLILDVFTTKK